MRGIALAFLVALPLAAHAKGGSVTVVAAGGTPLARDVAGQLERKGLYVELAPGGAAPAPAMPLDQAKACLSEGRQQAFRLEYGAAIAALESCLERLGPALARPEGQPALSALLVELGAAAVGAGERERARSAFTRLSHLPDATPPDPGVHPPPVMAAWEEAKRGNESMRSVTVEATPPWTTVWIDGRPATGGDRISVAQGPHFASAEAPGFQPWSGVLLVEGDTARLPVRLAPLDPEARAAAVRNRAAAIPPTAPGAAEELTAAFGMPVVVVAGRGGTTNAILLLPAEPGKGGAGVGGRWTPSGTDDPASVIATGVAKKIGRGGGTDPIGPKGPGRRGGFFTRERLYIAGGALAGVLAVGAAVTLLQPGDPAAGDKEGSVVWEPPPPPRPTHGPP